MDKEDAVKTLGREKYKRETAEVVKEDVQDQRKEVNECEEDWAVVLFVPVDQKESNTSVTENFLTVTYNKEVAQQVVYIDHVNKAMKIG